LQSVSDFKNTTKTTVTHTHTSTVTPSNPKSTIRHIPGKPFQDISKFYSFGQILGKGKLGITYFCTENSTGLNYACMSILKRSFKFEDDREKFRREIRILQLISGQPNIMEFKGAYKDHLSVHPGKELCAGGERFDRIVIAQPECYSERAVASICV